MHVLLCLLHSQLPVCYLSSAAGIFKVGFLPESWLLLFSTSISPFTVPAGLQSSLLPEACTRSYHRVQDVTQKATGAVYTWGETRARKATSRGTGPSCILLHYGSRVFPLKSDKWLNKSYLTHIILSLGRGQSLVSAPLFSVHYRTFLQAALEAVE